MRVQALVNTVELPGGPDRLANFADARPWLVANNLLAPHAELTPDDLALVRGVREALRALLVRNAGGPPPDPAALAPLRDVAAAGRARAELEDDGTVRLEAAGNSVADRLSELMLDHPRRPTRRQLDTTKGLRERRMPMGVLRPLPQSRRHLVRDGRMRQQAKEPRLSGPAARGSAALQGANAFGRT